MRPDDGDGEAGVLAAGGAFAKDGEGEERAEEGLQPHDDDAGGDGGPFEGGEPAPEVPREEDTGEREQGQARARREGDLPAGAGDGDEEQEQPGGEEEAVGGDREGRGFVREAYEDGGPGDAKHAEEEHGQRRPGNRHGRHATGARGGKARGALGVLSEPLESRDGENVRGAAGSARAHGVARRCTLRLRGKGCGAGGRCFLPLSTRRHARTCACWNWRRRWRVWQGGAALLTTRNVAKGDRGRVAGGPHQDAAGRARVASRHWRCWRRTRHASSTRRRRCARPGRRRRSTSCWGTTRSCGSSTSSTTRE